MFSSLLRKKPFQALQLISGFILSAEFTRSFSAHSKFNKLKTITTFPDS